VQQQPFFEALGGVQQQFLPGVARQGEDWLKALLSAGFGRLELAAAKNL
jgi:hypothetical protein